MKDLELVTIHSCNPADGTILVFTEDNSTPVPAVQTSATPLDTKGGGDQCYPLPDPGIRALAWKHNGVYYIISYTFIRNIFGHFAPGVTRNELSPGEKSMRTQAGNYLRLDLSGALHFFSDIWARLGISRTEQALTGAFKRLRMFFLTGSFNVSYDENEDTGNITLIGGRTYENIESNDVELAPEQYRTPQYFGNFEDATSDISSSFSKYTDKGFIKLGNHNNSEHLLSLETRQFTGTENFGLLLKDVVTYDKRGYQGDDIGTLREFVIIDRVRGVINKEINTSNYYNSEIVYYTPVLKTKEDQNLADNNYNKKFISTISRESYIVQYEDLAIKYNKTITDGILETITDKVSGTDIYSKEIDKTGKITVNAKTSEINYDMAAGDICSIVFPNAQITIDYDGNIIIDKFVSLKFGSAELAEPDAIMTPNKVFENKFNKDPFTGMPYVGSTKVFSS